MSDAPDDIAIAPAKKINTVMTNCYFHETGLMDRSEYDRDLSPYKLDELLSAADTMSNHSVTNANGTTTYTSTVDPDVIRRMWQAAQAQ